MGNILHSRMSPQIRHRKTAAAHRVRQSHGSVLGLETSCDETAAAIMDTEGRVLSNIISSQHDVHRPFGGVVPELASRSHIQAIETVTRTALEQAALRWPDIGSVAVTQGPGLAGALLVGLS